MWNKALELGIEEVDNQHKKLIELTDHVYELIKEAKEGLDCYDQIVSVFKELEDYAVYHFKYEEEILAKKGFLQLIEHKKAHDDFIKKLSTYSFEEMDYNQLESLHSILDFLLEWVSNHIMVLDKQYISTLKDE